MYYPAVHRNSEVLFLGDERQLVALEDSPLNDGVVVGTVVADEQKIPAGWEPFLTDDIVSHAQAPQNESCGTIEKRPVKSAVPVVLFLCINEKSADEQEQEQQQERQDHYRNNRDNYPQNYFQSHHQPCFDDLSTH